MICKYSIYIFECKLVWTVFLCVKIQMYHISSYFKCVLHINVYNRNFIKVKRFAEKKMHLKNVSTVLIAVLNILLIGMLCCFVVNIHKLKVRC